MEKLNFYEIHKSYIKYLKQFEEKIPTIEYDAHDKFTCGIVLAINDLHYYAPVSSFNKQQKTNFLIYNEKNEPISSIRFSFMFPAPLDCVKVKDFNSEPYQYRRLLITELDYCNKHVSKIIDKAKSVYNFGCNKNHVYNYLCCNFKLLEEKCLAYSEIQKAMQEAAVTSRIEQQGQKRRFIPRSKDIESNGREM
ncbi:MAG: type III toxin-antitoxin system ToxN/AbiQ family toxin [Clostridia bacterium]|nr:type III toxin-antitoxin system ToxN/AbiQ family toxin [Clostridia bacterium]